MYVAKIVSLPEAHSSLKFTNKRKEISSRTKNVQMLPCKIRTTKYHRQFQGPLRFANISYESSVLNEILELLVGPTSRVVSVSQF